MHVGPGMMVTANVRLERPLGAGAMGSVWVAHHLTLKTNVAVKFISTDLANDPGILARFTQEASVAAQIKSPHVVQTFDQGVMSDGTPYIVMELLEGGSLQEQLEQSGALPLVDAATVITQVARALTRAHEIGVVHRDIKPDNIFVTPGEDGPFCKILDFGIAKQTALPQMGGLTNPGIMVGTPEYMSPEQVLSAKDVDYRADLWGLAVTMYHALTGQLPFTAEALGTLCVKLLDGSFTPPSELRADLPRALDDWFTRAMAHEPSARFDNARQMAQSFVQIVAAAGVYAPTMSLGELTPLSTSALSSAMDGVGDTAPLGTSARGDAGSPARVPSTTSPEPRVASSETLTGSSSNRRREDRSLWPIALGALVLLATGAGLLLTFSPGSAPQDDATPATQPTTNALEAPPEVETSSARSDRDLAAEGIASASASPSASASTSASAVAAEAPADKTPPLRPETASPSSRPSQPGAPTPSSGSKPRFDHGF